MIVPFNQASGIMYDSFNYVVPIPAGRLKKGPLTKISKLMVRDAHDMVVNGVAKKAIFLGSNYSDFTLAHSYKISGAEVRRNLFLELNIALLNNDQAATNIEDDQMIIIPRGLDTINKFIALRKFLKDLKSDSPTIAIIAPDIYFAKRIDMIADLFFDNGELAKHQVIVMGYEHELDDKNREKREEKMLERTLKFFQETGLINNPQFRDAIGDISEDALCRIPLWQQFFDQCSAILEIYPVTGKESPYVAIEKRA